MTKISLAFSPTVYAWGQSRSFNDSHGTSRHSPTSVIQILFTQYWRFSFQLLWWILVKSIVYNACSEMCSTWCARSCPTLVVGRESAEWIHGTYGRSDAIELLISAKNRSRSVKHYPVTGELVTSRAQQAKNNIC